MKIKFEEISVIVRGLIVGAGETDEKKKFTKRALLSVRQHLPGAKIILSTWKGSNVEGLDYDELILNDPPIAPTLLKSDGTLKFMTGNNQIVAMRNGLEKSQQKYTLTMRSDMILLGTRFVDYFLEFNQTKDSVVFEKRIVTLPTYNPRRKAVYSFLFNVSDWLYFGLTADIQKMLDIPLMSEDRLLGEKENGHYLYDENFETEQYIWSTFLKKYQPVPLPQPKFFSEEALVASEESYARNLILLPAQKAQVDCLKMPHAGYGARPILSQGLYTFNEYKKMYNRYSSKKVLYIPNPAENLLYWTLLKTRLLLKKISPEKYKKIVNSVRRLHRSDNLLK
jgi:hypothetical protein